MFKLVIQDDEGKTTVVPLIRDEITIGRKEGNTIRLTERNVSRRHARILRNNGEVQIEDLGSYNGIRVNNARIAERVSLRLSDQVQIGDYKLYLKAEGVEQVDEARTMPIERVENGGPTEAMPSINSAPTAPLQAPTGTGQRAAIAVADTDPAGRPVATAAQVAALTAPAGYGKMVIVSSNFAGKEFELTRPQMIVGRTDENNLVVNHRSISRNHAKITRDPETQRYTISDLQSSNGVRVNGQDYGKVELRRADIVNLGHVRMRFVEPGEDFVFARDAEIMDVPEASGGRKGIYTALFLAVLVLGAAGAYFVLKNNGKDEGNAGGTNEGSNNGSSALVVTNNNGSQQGSDNAGMQVEQQADAGAVAAVGSNATAPDDKAGETARKRNTCLNLVTQKDWSTLEVCANELSPADPTEGARLKKLSKTERKAKLFLDTLGDEIGNQNLVNARKALNQIPEDSVYRNEAQKKFDTLEGKFFDDAMKKGQLLAQAKKCDDFRVHINQTALKIPRAAEQLRLIKCVDPVVAPATDCKDSLVRGLDKACVKQYCLTHETTDPSHCGGQANTGGGACDADALQKEGMAANGQGNHVAALQRFEESLRCKADAHTVELAFMEACQIPNQVKARQYWKKLSPERQPRLIPMCQRNKIDKPQLDGTAP